MDTSNANTSIPSFISTCNEGLVISNFTLNARWFAGHVIVVEDGGVGNTSEITGLTDFVVRLHLLNSKGSDEIPSYRQIGHKVLNSAKNVSTGMKCSDSQSGYHALSRKAMENQDNSNKVHLNQFNNSIDAADKICKILELNVNEYKQMSIRSIAYAQNCSRNKNDEHYLLEYHFSSSIYLNKCY